MKIFTEETKRHLKWKWQDFKLDCKRLIPATYLCYKYPFLKSWRKEKMFFQTWCWYYAIPDGWRKAFGMQMLKEIRESLIRTDGRRALKAMHISDIKEKWGTLNVYCDATNEVYKILQKYEYISSYTCIDCGKPATVQSTGWICPYCEEHVGNRNHIHFGHKHGPSWYGWSGNIDMIPKDVWDAEEKLLNDQYGDDDSTSSEKAS